MQLKIKVVPGASSDSIGPWLGDALKIRISSPPENNRANKAVRQLLAKTLNIAPGKVNIIKGHSNPNKIIELEGVEDSTVREVFGTPC